MRLTLLMGYAATILGPSSLPQVARGWPPILASLVPALCAATLATTSLLWRDRA